MASVNNYVGTQCSKLLLKRNNLYFDWARTQTHTHTHVYIVLSKSHKKREKKLLSEDNFLYF